MVTTERFMLTVGVTPGYGHGNERGALAASRVATLWQACMRDEYVASGIVVSAVIDTALVVYLPENGCPRGGEVVAVVRGTRNPARSPNAQAWGDAVIRIAAAVRRKLEQTTSQVEFDHVDMEYLTA